MASVDVGQTAPDFNLFDTAGEQVSLSRRRGKNVVIAFFPGAFTGVCTTELCSFRDSMADYGDLDAVVLAISVDSHFANDGFAKANNLNFPVLSDYSRKAVNDYGVALNDFAGMEGYTAAQRAVFVIDKDGTVRWKWIADSPGTLPDFDAVKRAVADLH